MFGHISPVIETRSIETWSAGSISKYKRDKVIEVASTIVGGNIAHMPPDFPISASSILSLSSIS